VRAASLTLVPWGSARILEERCSVTYKWLFLLFGIWPVGHALEAAQTPAAHSVLAEENDESMITLLRTVSAPIQFATPTGLSGRAKRGASRWSQCELPLWTRLAAGALITGISLPAANCGCRTKLKYLS
jgi:hypothetical protein